MTPIPRYRISESELAPFLSAGFRPFFLLSALWAAIILPVTLAYMMGGGGPPARLSPLIWHAHEMAFGFGGGVVAGFLLTAIPNWTGRMPLQGAPLGGLVLLWLLGRLAVLVSASLPAAVVAALDLSFPAVFLASSRGKSSEAATGETCRCWPRSRCSFSAIFSSTSIR